ncbi:MAG: hypothetical protein KDC54_13560, partial [Lewinella sp.]|nr:hypothetical protein [Lewinella sp.]
MHRNIITILLLVWSMGIMAQSNRNLGLGYFGHTITYPGAVLEMEFEQVHSASAASPLRINLGYYQHARSHNGLFLDINYGFRHYTRSGFFLEESIGVGILQTILNGEDGVFQVDDEGNVSKGSRFNQPDFMPSITLGLGYNVGRKQET